MFSAIFPQIFACHLFIAHLCLGHADQFRLATALTLIASSCQHDCSVTSQNWLWDIFKGPFISALTLVDDEESAKRAHAVCLAKVRD